MYDTNYAVIKMNKSSFEKYRITQRHGEMHIDRYFVLLYEWMDQEAINYIFSNILRKCFLSTSPEIFGILPGDSDQQLFRKDIYHIYSTVLLLDVGKRQKTRALITPFHVASGHLEKPKGGYDNLYSF